MCYKTRDYEAKLAERRGQNDEECSCGNPLGGFVSFCQLSVLLTIEIFAPFADFLGSSLTTKVTKATKEDRNPESLFVSIVFFVVEKMG